MSDTSQGPGWWQASDGKWYAPELYPKDWHPGQTAQDVETDEAEEAAGAVEESDDLTTDLAAAASAVTEPALVGEPDAVDVTDVADAETAPQVELGSRPAAAWSASTADTAPTTADPAPPTGWSTTDPAAGEVTAARGVPAVSVPDATAVQPAVGGAAPQPAPSPWDAPAEPPWGAVPPSADVRAATQKVRAGGPDIPGGALGIVGGAVAIAGSFLVWAEATGSVRGEVNGLTGSNGWGTLIAGLVIAAAGALLIAGLRGAWVGGLMIAAGVTAVGLVVFSVIDIGNTSDDLPAAVLAQGYSAEIANAAALETTTGVWLPLIGGAVGIGGGVAAVLRRP